MTLKKDLVLLIPSNESGSLSASLHSETPVPWPATAMFVQAKRLRSIE